MKLIKLKSLIAVGAMASALASASPFTSLDKAHEAYLKGDVSLMARHLRDTLTQNPPESVKRNALQLLESAYAKYPDRKIETDWQLPTEVRKLKFTQRRATHGDHSDYALKIAGNTAERNVIKQIQVVKYPNKVVLDKQAQLGEWEETLEENPQEGIYFELDGPSLEVPAAEGLYLVHLETNNGSKVDGWFILSDLASSKSPAVQVPAPNEIFTTGNPTFRYEDFVSPEYKETEWRSGWFAVIKMEAPHYNWTPVWTVFTMDLPRTHLTIGKEEDAVGVSSLVSGNYRFYAAYKEQRKFGPMQLGRQSVSSVPFKVR